MTSTPETVDQSSPGRLAAARPPAIVAPKSPGLNSLTLPQQTALSFSTSTTPSPNNISISTYAKGTSPYYVTELMRFRHSCLLGLFWLLSFLGFVLLLVWSNEMQYESFSFCDTPVTRSCSLLSSMNASDLSWVDAASSCFDAGFSAEWYSGGGFSTTMHVFGKDAIPTMSSPLRRHSRFVLRFITTDYTIVEDSLFSATNGPQVQSLVRVSEDGVVLMPAVTLDILPITNVFTLNFAAGSQNGAIIFELPTGYRFPEGTQQLALIFPGGPPLAPLYSIGDAGRGPVQLTFATSTPAYIIADTILRYVLIVANLGVVVLVFCLHALADTNVYPINDPTVPSGEAWFAWIRSVRCVMQREYPHVGGIWRRLPFFVKCTVMCLLTSTLLCDPLAAAFAGVPDNVFLKFWSLHLMPWWRFTWMVVTSAWLLACLITCGDTGRMFTIPRSVAAISDPVRSRVAAFISGPSVWAFRSSLRWSTRAL
ncbi:transmembrane protein, putative, partial [Bodo saltans]